MAYGKLIGPFSVFEKNPALCEGKRKHDACGSRAVVNFSGQKSHAIIEQGKQILLNLFHCGATAGDKTSADAVI